MHNSCRVSTFSFLLSISLSRLPKEMADFSIPLEPIEYRCYKMAHISCLKYLQLELERIIGLTTATPSGLTCNGVNEELAYVAGCVVVIYNVKTNCQTHFLMARGNPKPFSCVAFSSQGGKYIAAGEVLS